MKLPGFIDSHMHYLGLGYTSSNVDLTKANSIVEIIALLKEELPKPVLIGRGWNQENLLEKRMLNKEDLNAVSRDIPIIMTRVCGHVLTANDKMLELAGITKDTIQVDGGTFNYDTGVFSENALSLILSSLSKPTTMDLENYLQLADKILLKNGITSVASDDFCIFNIPFEDVIAVINKMVAEDKIHVNITEQVNLPLNELKRFIEKGFVNKEFKKFKMGPLKILADGSLGGKTAYLNKPYEDDPSNRGIYTYSDDELFELIHLANSNGMDVVIHAIGDASVDQVLKCLIKSIEQTKRFKHHHAIIHAQLATHKQIKLMKKYHIGAIIQPIFLNSDIKIIESRIGERMNESYLFKTMVDEGLNVGFSTDSPIEPINPFYNIYSAITRKSIKEPDLKAFLVEEGCDLETALKCYTINNLPYIKRKEMPLGDYIVIDKNIYDINSKSLLNISILETYIDNELVYKKAL
ncbi:MAG: amidohydrolase [Tenericutes bacterium]|nr:amidohydrolase [Mycoplasmatota bacterium]